MRAVVGVTDTRWASFLRERPHITEANFWTPSGAGFRALAPGEPFLFKTHAPENALVGGGFFSGFTELSVAEAWTLFGEGNGVDSMEELARRVAHYRRAAPDHGARIGCVLLRDLFFPPPGNAIPAPADFSPNVVRYKGYDLEDGSHDVSARLDAILGSADIRLSDLYEGGPSLVTGPTRGLPQLTRPRVGQQAFKGLVLTSYHRRCAITGGRIEPTLQAAHIRPVAMQGEHRVDNGLLLRSDVHTLFDQGYLGLDEHHRLQVSTRLQADWGNGQEFYDRSGQVIALPERNVDRPSREAVVWHMDTVFLR